MLTSQYGKPSPRRQSDALSGTRPRPGVDWENTAISRLLTDCLLPDGVPVSSPSRLPHFSAQAFRLRQQPLIGGKAIERSRQSHGCVGVVALPQVQLDQARRQGRIVRGKLNRPFECEPRIMGVAGPFRHGRESQQDADVGRSHAPGTPKVFESLVGG
jgi:hypothetical protein